VISAFEQPMKNEPWKQYYEEFRTRSNRVPPDAFERRALLYEAAHDAYETTTNRLTEAGWEQERALMIGRMFGAVVKEWVDRDGHEFERLESELEMQYQQWTAAE
jgi:hypothetical protein